MVDVAPSTNPNTPSARQQTTAGSGPASSAVNSDFDTFIRMLTAQVENQDPLNPMDSTDFATQLATFSGVEQQVLTNDLLTALATQLMSDDLSKISGWIGMEARAVTPVNFDGAAVKLTVGGHPEGDAHQLVVRDSTGEIVARRDIDGARQTLLWEGLDESGDPLPPGLYDVSVVSLSEGEEFVRIPAEVHGLILEARMDGFQPLLIMAGGQEVLPGEILGLRAAG